MIVVDTKLIAYLFLPGDKTAAAERVFKSDSEWIAPFLWRSEFRSVLALYMKSEDLALENALKIMNKAESLLKGKEYTIDSASVLECSQKNELSAYDSEFVSLAEYLNIKLVSFDKRVLKNASAVSVSPTFFC